EERLRLHRRQASERAVHQAGTSRLRDPRAADRAERDVLHDGRQPRVVVRLPRLGACSTGESDRRGLRDILAAEPDLDLFDLRFAWPRAGRASAPASKTEASLALSPGPAGGRSYASDHPRP